MPNLLRKLLALLLLAVTTSFTFTRGSKTTIPESATVSSAVTDNSEAALVPTFTNCPSDITNVMPNSGDCTAVVNWTPPTASGTGPVTVTSNYDPGDSFYAGTHRVIYRATDINGTSFCEFTVEVLDNQPPVINVPANVNTTADPGLCGAIVTFPYPQATDNCPAGESAPIDENFDSGTDLSTQCYDFDGTFIGTDGEVNGSVGELETVELINNDIRSFTSPLTQFNGTGEIFFDHKIIAGSPSGDISNGARLTVKLINTGGVETIIFTELYLDENVQTEYIPITQSGNFYVQFEWETNQNRSDIAYLDDLYIPGYVISDTTVVTCGVARHRVVQIAGQPYRSGQEFPVGTTTLEYLTRDAAGNIGFNSFTVTVTNNINPPAGNDVEYCEGTPVPELSVTVGAGETVDWYDAAVGGTLLLADSATYTPPGPGNYYAETRNISTGCVSGTRRRIRLIENPQPNSPSAPSPIEYCVNETATPLTATGDPGNMINWYDAPTGGTMYASAPTPDTTIASTTSYYVEQVDSSTFCVSTRTEVVVTVYSRPTVPSITTPIEYCVGDTAAQLDTHASGTNLRWYDAATGGSEIPGSTIPDTSSAGTQFFWVTQTAPSGGTNCESTRAMLTVNVNNPPLITTQPTDQEMCSGGTATFTGDASNASGFQWQYFNGGSWDNITDDAIYSGATTNTLTITGNPPRNQYRLGATSPGGSCPGVFSNPAALTINPLPNVTANATDTEICQGESVTLTGSGANTYSWDNGVTDGVPFTPASTTTYTVTGTDANGCTDTDTITITVNPLPTITVTSGPTCSTDLSTYAIDLSTSTNNLTTTAGTVSDLGGGNFTVDNIPAGTDITLTTTNSNGCPNTLDITAPDCSCPAISAPVSGGNAEYCAGDTVPTITASVNVGETVDWYDQAAAGTLLLSDNTSFTPAGPGTYYAEARNTTTGCVSGTRTAIIVTENALPTVTANATQTTICVGDSVTLTGSGANSYTWDNGVTDGVAFTPASTTTYTVTGTDANGCINTDTITITVNPRPAVTANATDTEICQGEPVTLTGSGANSYTWDNGVSDGVAFTPASTTTYTVTGTDINGCTDTDTITVTVNPRPAVTANATDTEICQGESVTLTGSGANSYTWDNGVTDGVAFTPASTTTYTVTGTDANGCNNTDTVTITVNPLPTYTVTSGPACAPDLLTYSISINTDADSVTSDVGVATITNTGGNDWTVSDIPSGTNITVTATNTSTSCSAPQSFTAPDCSCPTINPPVSGGNAEYCAGDSVPTISASVNSGETIDWYDQAAAGTLLLTGNTDFIPAGPGTYYAEARNTTTSCVSTTRTAITVTENPLPIVTANATDTELCQGESVTLTGSGANSYTWDNGVVDGVAFTPASTTTYTVTGTDANGCQNTDTITIQVNPLPTVVANATDTEICQGESVTLTGSGANSYTWDNGVTDGGAFAPTSTTTYTVTGTDANGCQNTDTITITVNPLPTVTANATQTTLCAGESVTLTGSGANSYTWDNGVSDGVAFAPATTTTYTVTGTDSNGCTDTDTITINVNPLPTFTVTTGPSCAPDLLSYSISINTDADSVVSDVGAATITNTGGNDWTVSNIPSGTDITITVTNTATSCSVSQGFTAPNCSCPTIDEPIDDSGDQAYCIGDTVPTISVSVNAGETVDWYDQPTNGTLLATATLSYQPTAGDLLSGNNTFYAEARNTTTNCTSSTRRPVIITQNPLPTVTANASQTTICAGDSVTLTGSGANSYTWDNGVTDGVAFTLTSTTTYTVTGTDVNGCQNTDTITITVNPLPIVAANATDTEICLGESVTLTGSGANSYTWDNGISDGVAFNPTTTTTYNVTGTDINGCQNTDTLTITVNPLPTVVANASSTTINAGEPVTLTGSGATTYTWDNGVNDGDTVFPLVTTTYTVIGTDSNGCDNTDSVTITVGATSDIRLEKTVDIANPNVGDTVAFTLTATNDGPSDDTGGSIVTDVLPIGYTYISDTGNAINGNYNSVSGAWTLPALINGSSVSITISASVNAPTGTANEYTNIAEVTTATNFDSDSAPNNDDGDQSEDDEASIATTPQVADLEITNTISQPTANPGDALTLTVDVLNNGPNDATNINLDNIVPSGFVVTSINNGGTQTGNTISWNGINIPNGTSSSLSFEVTVNNPTGAINEYLNTVQVTAVDQFDADSTPNNDDGDQSEDDEDNVVLTLQSTDLEITNTVTPDSGNPGDTLTFTIDLINNGADDATNVAIENVVPSGFTVVNIANGGTQTGNIISWNGLNIPNGTNIALSFEVTINVPTNTSGEYFNTVQVTAVDQLDPDSTPNNDDGDQSEDDEDNAEIVLIPADLSLTKTLNAASNQTPNAGDTVTFELTLTNEGPGIATNVTVEDILPTGFTLGTINNGGTVSGSTISWTIPTLAVGSEIITYQATLNAPTNTLDEYTNIAQVMTSDQFDPDSAPNNDDGDQSEDDETRYTIDAPTVDLEINKTVDKQQTFFEDTIVFTVSASNNSSYDATNIGIEDVLPSGYQLVSSEANLGTYNEAIGTWEIPVIAIGETATLQMTVTVTDIEDYTNIAQLIYVDQIDPNLDNDRAEVTPEVTQEQCLTVFNEFSPNNDGANDSFFIECIEQYPNNMLQVFNRWGNKVFEMKNYDNSWDGTSMNRATISESEKLPVGTYYYILSLGDNTSTPKSGWLYISR
mgnify:CR=1 FL=1